MRSEMLNEEYKLRESMEYFEHTIFNVLRDVKMYNVIEFYYEKDSL